MPTGYTADIANGITFEQYAWSCARAFGALVTMRDDPNDAQIPEKFEPTDYHLKAIAEAKARAEELRTLGGQALRDAHAAAQAAERAETQRRSEDRRALRAKYEAMLQQARAYKAPTPDHEEYAKFLVKQIEESIDFDCAEYPPSQSVPATAGEWRAQQLGLVMRSIGYHEGAQEKEIERTNSRNAWIAALRESLEPRQ